MKIDETAVLSVCFSPWVTPGPSLLFFFFLFFFPVTLFSFFFLPCPLFHAHLLSVSLLPPPLRTPSPPHFLSFALFALLPPPPPRTTLHPPVLHSLCPLQPQSADLLPLVGDERGFCLPPAAVTWRHAGGGSEIEDEPAVSATPALTSRHVCAWNGLQVGGKNRVCVFFYLQLSKFFCIIF